MTADTKAASIEATALPPLPERLTHEQADAYVQRCREAIERSATWTGAPPAAQSARADTLWPLDTSALQHFDSSALAALLAVSRLLQVRGGRLQVRQMPLRLRELAALYGVSELLEA